MALPGRRPRDRAPHLRRGRQLPTGALPHARHPRRDRRRRDHPRRARARVDPVLRDGWAVVRGDVCWR